MIKNLLNKLFQSRYTEIRKGVLRDNKLGHTYVLDTYSVISAGCTIAKHLPNKDITTSPPPVKAPPIDPKLLPPLTLEQEIENRVWVDSAIKYVGTPQSSDTKTVPHSQIFEKQVEKVNLQTTIENLK